MLCSLIRGSTFFIESSLKKPVDYDSKDVGGHGAIHLTGPLGDVMREILSMAHRFCQRRSSWTCRTTKVPPESKCLSSCYRGKEKIGHLNIRHLKLTDSNKIEVSLLQI